MNYEELKREYLFQQYLNYYQGLIGFKLPEGETLISFVSKLVDQSLAIETMMSSAETKKTR